MKELGFENLIPKYKDFLKQNNNLDLTLTYTSNPVNKDFKYETKRN
jgi:hypothetical protein